MSQAPQPTTRHPVRILFVIDADSREPLVDADVVDLITHNSVKTSKDGAVGLFVPQFVNATGAILLVRKLGYEPIGGISVDPGADTTLIVALHHAVTSLPTMTTTAPYRVDRDAGQRAGLTRRCAAPHATCIGEDQLDDHPVYRLSDFLRGSGKTIPGTSAEPQMHSTSGGNCTPAYYVDGFLWNGRFADKNSRDHSPSIDAIFVPRDVVAIEVYAAEQARPMRFAGGDPNCGAIVVWTK